MRPALLSIIIIIIINFILPPTDAADSTPSASVKEKLEELKQEIASKAAKLKQEVDKKLTNKAYIGIVKSKSSGSITLAGRGGSKLVSLNQDTVYEDTNPTKKGSKKIIPSLQTLKEESNIAALGDVDDTGVLHAKKIVILSPPTSHIPKSILWGQITSISDDLISVKTKEASSAAVAITKIDTKIKLSEFVIITGVKSKNDIIDAGFLYVIPSGAIVKPKTATPSATATKSGKKK